ncbi:MAG: glycoside hydrolase [Pseudomonadales bacterium]|uniref:glycoside hydrolase family 57 protein n=1 Tax=unclassified Ketobacter TaxID=2639109 RepID=UPI000C8D6309|nr:MULTISPECIES: glycoside hydrolase family 57 protein [unclassified Ketobacter]MAA59532.1 glycoside hydrolase [Pseudomonadales bacterium]MEC8813125.1 glycoside hydrolase family 57 protein [Pseudomonadota bacterium]TNC90064.1 MAG: glycoside hydrolase [Alcanivorax sp.]HCB40470.1 glycoside hydrolase [Gammaproteobacteria bacterium]MAQ26341.1 glycoside hydrolase [Pseudomonadales bacterium]|tara:strand:- start:70754 stop:72457 length:1704 start_codon:yes stop_codon:yes gene_type:complete
MSHKIDDHPKVNVVLCWHMHQPQYQDQFTHNVRLPWTYLHAIKDYADMAAVVEQVPQSRVVVNFTPVLLDQIDDYIQQFDRYFNQGEPFNDRLLATLAMATIGPTESLRLFIARQCIRANEKRLIERFPPFRDLVQLARQALHKPGYLNYLDEQFFFDLLVWYHLVWMGETVRMENETIQRLIRKARGFTSKDRRELLGVIDTLIRSVVPRYRHLAESGQMEISVTPDKHPILPLMLDFKSTLEAMPDALLPQRDGYPDGRERAIRHLRKGIDTFVQHFGFKPVGCWPSEGALSEATLELLAEIPFQWTASGGGVLGNSKHANKLENLCIHHGFRLRENSVTCFFRDDNLSDLIGFTYSGWNEHDAVNNLIHHIENIRSACNYRQDTVVPIILDGENCWEYYPHNGYHFLKQLYSRLVEHPKIQLTTFRDYLKYHNDSTRLPSLVAGSWVYGTFSTWIGDPAKNRAWDLLCKAKDDFDRVMASGRLAPEIAQRAEEQLAICEGSDWFWWFGDYNPAESVADFDQLYRAHLRNLYRFLDEPAPPELEHVISRGGGAQENDGVMRRGQG